MLDKRYKRFSWFAAFCRKGFFLVGCVLAGSPVFADTRDGISFAVTDQHGEPLADVVVYALPDDDMGPAAPAIMDQVNHAFVPHVLPVQRGAAVDFPNSDDVRHHVYSFSEAKSFELPLYSGVPAEPVYFDKAGEVVLGCNIHDRMLGYIYVVDTSVFAHTGPDGRARLDRLPTAATTVYFWHPRAEGSTETLGVSRLEGRDESIVELEMSVTPTPAARHDHESSELDGLQQRFRRFRSP